MVFLGAYAAPMKKTIACAEVATHAMNCREGLPATVFVAVAYDKIIMRPTRHACESQAETTATVYGYKATSDSRHG